MSGRSRLRFDNAPWPDDAPAPATSAHTAAVSRLRDSLDDLPPPRPPTAAPAVENAVPAAVGSAETPPSDEILPDPAAARRSLRRRIAPQPAAPHPPRGRRSPQDLPPPTATARDADVPNRRAWRAGPVWALAIAVVWMGALALLLLGPARLQALELPSRLVIPGGWAVAALATFLPLQVRMALPGVTWQGMLGFGMLGYLLAFAPAPTGWLLELPDVPVYLLFVALFYAVGATALPVTYALGQRFYSLRVHRHDIGRARRQAYELAMLAVTTFVLAGLRVLNPISFGLLTLVLVLTEALLLSQVQPEG